MPQAKRRAPDDVQLSHSTILGEGTFGVVVGMRQSKRSLTWVAVKKIKRVSRRNGAISVSAMREVVALHSLHHRNVMYAVGSYLSDGQLLIVMPHGGDTLRTLINGDVKHNACSIMHDLACGLDYCHRSHIMHRDLKPENVLVKNGVAVVADFGSMRFVHSCRRRYTIGPTTLWYRAPEDFFGDGHYNEKIDIWSLGCIFAEMCTGQPLFNGKSEVDTVFRIFQFLGHESAAIFEGFPNFTSGMLPRFRRGRLPVDDAYHSILWSMLEPDPAQRTTASALIDAFKACMTCVPRCARTMTHNVRDDTCGSSWLQQPTVTLRMRHKLLKWIVRLSEACQFHVTTALLAFSVIDRYAGRRTLEIQTLHLVGIVAVLIATKLDHHNDLTLETCVECCAHEYTSQQVEDMEHNVMDALDWFVSTRYSAVLCDTVSVLRRAHERQRCCSAYIGLLLSAQNVWCEASLVRTSINIGMGVAAPPSSLVADMDEICTYKMVQAISSL